ncbi:Acyl-CoA N-acyltransferase [Penicillium cf. griseofulvum]|uniref:Acyl-CoA N-acyltransferase n=1 Tax=Penicillium cf. griseofulvum TaxID=2972120 RepID=A0A9W9IP08_9EURO|nr:Acyl-CoA N-acyltransferase [Penicillium cf. griseofulvum]KAJ5443037.1 Acyl-CoA N-acyltransferase [Penicillium cf. griseofulvum]KAJ5451692.1 Acyl-CoA N-acyltransferase [Penicillium cf. griseofulvum]
MPTSISTHFSIPTERLHISYLEPGNHSHSTFLHHIWNTDEFLMAEGNIGIDTPEKADKFITNKVQPTYKKNGYGQMLVSLKPYPEASLAESKPIGIVSLMKGDGENAYTAPDVGYTILPEGNGKGYATEAAIGLIAYAKREFGVNEVFGFCDHDNKRSRRVLEKIGMEFRGERHLKYFGGAHSAVYALPGMEDLKNYGIEDV